MNQALDESWLILFTEQLIVNTKGRSLSSFFYSEITLGCCSNSVFVDEGNRIVWETIDDQLLGALYEYWLDLPEKEQWSVMRFLLAADGQFSVSFSYPDEIDVDDFDPGSARREAAVRAVFGDKPIYYPPHRFTYDLGDGHETGFDGPLG